MPGRRRPRPGPHSLGRSSAQLFAVVRTAERLCGAAEKQRSHYNTAVSVTCDTIIMT